MTVRFWQIIGFICMLLVARGSGQTTQPSTQSPQTPWNDYVNRIATVLVENPGSASLSQLIADDVSVRQFGSAEVESRYRLQQKTTGMVAIATRAYAWPIATLASDLAGDLRDCDALPEPVRKQFIPRDDADTTRANSVAQQWISGVLQPAAGDYVGVIVFWEKPPPTGSLVLSSNSENKQPVFVLVKGQKTDDDQFRITQVAYGDARQALN
jgi:hypothetical protein